MSARPNPHPTPKARFQESSQNLSKHRDLIESNDFQRACDFAMLEYQAKIVQHSNDNQLGAMAGFFRMLGAQEYLSELRRLAEMPTIIEAKPDNSNLIHTLK